MEKALESSRKALESLWSSPEFCSLDSAAGGFSKIQIPLGFYSPKPLGWLLTFCNSQVDPSRFFMTWSHSFSAALSLLSPSSLGVLHPSHRRPKIRSVACAAPELCPTPSLGCPFLCSPLAPLGSLFWSPSLIFSYKSGQVNYAAVTNNPK